MGKTTWEAIEREAEVPWYTCSTGRQDAENALKLLEEAEKNLTQVEESRQQEQRTWLSYAQGRTYSTLATFGARGDLDKAIHLFRNLLKEGERGLPAEEIYGSLVDALRKRGSFNEAEQALEEGLTHKQDFDLVARPRN